MVLTETARMAVSVSAFRADQTGFRLGLRPSKGGQFDSDLNTASAVGGGRDWMGFWTGFTRKGSKKHVFYVFLLNRPYGPV